MPSVDAIGMFICIAGFIVGLGAVIVIDIHGFLGRTSAYWTEATIRTHKVTKPLIWVGIMLAIVGGFLVFRNVPFSGVPLFLALIACALIVNGGFLSFSVSPYLLQQEREGRQRELLPASLQRKIVVSLIVSDIGWWGALMLLIYHITRS